MPSACPPSAILDSFRSAFIRFFGANIFFETRSELLVSNAHAT